MMITKNEYLDKVKEKLDITSDYELSKHLGITRSSVSNYRRNRNTLDDYTCFQIAEILEISPLEVIANVQAEKEKDEIKREFWVEKIKEFSKAASLVVALSLCLNQSQVFDNKSNNIEGLKFSKIQETKRYFILC